MTMVEALVLLISSSVAVVVASEMPADQAEELWKSKLKELETAIIELKRTLLTIKTEMGLEAKRG